MLLQNDKTNLCFTGLIDTVLNEVNKISGDEYRDLKWTNFGNGYSGHELYEDKKFIVSYARTGHPKIGVYLKYKKVLRPYIKLIYQLSHSDVEQFETNDAPLIVELISKLPWIFEKRNLEKSIIKNDIEEQRKLLRQQMQEFNQEVVNLLTSYKELNTRRSV